MTLEEMQCRDQFGHVLNDMGLTGTGVELGVFKGEYSNQLLRTWKGNLIVVDSYNEGTDFHLLWDSIRNNIEFVQDGRYRIIVNTTLSAVNYCPSELDFVYIDSDHSYDAVYTDIITWRSKIRSGGILCGHDYNELHRGVLEAVGRFTSYDMKESRLYLKECSSWFIQV